MANKVGRPKGSTSKAKNGKNVEILKFYDYQGVPIMKDNALYGIINFGSDNLYPNKIIDLYGTSVSFNSCINFTVNACFGNGLNYDKITDEIQRPNPSEDWDTLIRKIMMDYILFDAFSIQIIANKGDGYSYYHQPVLNVRLEQPDEDGKINHAYVSADWSKSSKYPPVALPMYHFEEDEIIEKGQIYIYYYHKYNPQNSFYGIPSYLSALDQIQAESQFQRYDLSSTVNNFCPIGNLTLPAVETDEERMAIIKQVTSLFTGAENSNRIMISFRTNQEEKPVEFTPFASNSEKAVDLFDNSNERVVNRILSAFKIPSRALVGFAVEDTGFANSGEFLQSAYNLFKVNVANNVRLQIAEVIDRLLQLNGYDAEIEFVDLKYTTEENNIDNVEENAEG